MEEVQGVQPAGGTTPAADSGRIRQNLARDLAHRTGLIVQDLVQDLVQDPGHREAGGAEQATGAARAGVVQGKG